MESNKLSILVLTDWFVPGYKAGGPIKSAFNMVRLLEDEVDFHIVTRNTDWEDCAPYDLEKDIWLERRGFKVKYLGGRYLRGVIREMRVARPGTALFFNGIYSPSFNAIPLVIALILWGNRKIVVSARGMLNQNAITLKSNKKKALLSIYGILGIEHKVLFHAASEAESTAITRVFPKAHVRVAANIPEPVSDQQSDVSERNLKKFLSVARISPVKNTLFLIEQFLECDKLTLELIGSDDDGGYMKSCEKAAEMAKADVRFIGPVSPYEVKEYMNTFGYGIFPTTGENFGHAIIEALAHGTPVIISDQTPWNDLEAFGAGWVIALVDKKRWVEVIRTAAALPSDEYARMSVKALDYVRSKFDFNEIRNQYLSLFGAKN